MSSQINKEFYEIETDEQFFKIKNQIEVLDKVINQAYNSLSFIADLSQIVAVQDWINRMKTKRNGLFNLSIIYTTKTSQKNDIKEYTCKFGDTLLIIATAVYGKKEYWQFLYVYNELQSDVLEPNQRLKIPPLNKDTELVFAKEFIEAIEDVT